MQVRPAFTVTIAVRDGATTIGSALDSLAAQTLDDFEIIVVDDGSGDGSGDVAREHETQPLVLTTSGTGVAVARNLAVTRARGRYLTWLDADDLFHASRIEAITDQLATTDDGLPLHTGIAPFALRSDRVALEHHRDRNLARWVEHWVEDPTELVTAFDTVEGPDRQDPPSIVRTHADLFTWVPPAQVVVVERDLFIQAGGFPTHARSGSDYLFLFNLSRLTDIREAPNGTYFYRIHPDSITRRTSIPWPMLSSAIAYRYGGLHQSVDRARARGDDASPRNLLLEDQIANVEPVELRRALPELYHLIVLLYPDRRQRRKLWRRLVSDALAEKVPVLGVARDRVRARRGQSG